MKLYTKRGDDGSTGLVGGKRVSKDSLRVEAYGHVDETNAILGVALACCDESMAEALREIQSDLFVIGSELATPPEDQPSPCIGEARVTQLEHWIDRASGEVAELKSFVLPGGSEAAARLHLGGPVGRQRPIHRHRARHSQSESAAALAAGPSEATRVIPAARTQADRSGG